MKPEIKNLTLPELEAELHEMGEPKFRAAQIYTWLHRGAPDFSAMTNLPLSLREKLADRWEITAPQAVRKLVSELDGTIKYL